MLTKKEQLKSKNNIATTQAWTLEDSQKPLTKFKIFLKYLKLYCQYSSISSFKYLVDSKKTWIERILWVIIHCVTICTLIFMVCISYTEYKESPILTSIDSDSHRTTDLDFPGIAICTINRISRQSATELANDILNANVTDMPVEEVLTLIMQLGNHYASEFSMDEDRNVEIDRLLTEYYKGPYDITETMKKLSPQCSTILLKCRLHGTDRNCSALFYFRKTQDGFCCTFNYAAESDDIPVDNPDSDKETEHFDVHKVMDLGIHRGLTVVLEPHLDDYLYPILPVKGWKVVVFNPHDYPDVTSGGVTEVIVMPRTETYVDVTATTFFSTDVIQSFPIHERSCIFANEMDIMKTDKYTYSDCIVNCKIQDIQTICGCRPFVYPRRTKKDNSWRICTNLDLDCLSKYKPKWWTVFPHDSNEEFLKNQDWALHCHNCYPACDDVTYDVLSSKSYMIPGNYKTDLLWDFNVTNQGILHVYFSKYGSIRLKQDVSSYWYELLSDIGGICGVFIGFSLISVVELLYFLALALRDLLRKESTVQESEDHEEEIQQIQSQTIRTIYWSELLPRSWQSVKYGQFPNNKTRY
nr:PREDICTED: sodium channel protein Nach-like [Linepithema humile]